MLHVLYHRACDARVDSSFVVSQVGGTDAICAGQITPCPCRSTRISRHRPTRLSVSDTYRPSKIKGRCFPKALASSSEHLYLGQITSQPPSHASSKDAHFLRDLHHCGLCTARPCHSHSDCVHGSCIPYISFEISPTHAGRLRSLHTSR